ncbi:hypothetical protein PTTG_01371 [Puccinia triticina 1-1 BBBD Race 1]|uniref:mannan endo-1,4-beta-mannosidase n=2 Tax=Puccinia triticina TaxID=208348 RepID=A0A180GJW6_PUCT1|nr:uncharacterized protein PtA15_14A430 [Puccinia triticina]OAV92253.1 hypothetical protein PTTG_01371 [Puccinia triticina 1-1 BBBD Race 1]WAQ91546.1 hypothetical protein PtA15_14A430 [Puccinia triticina]
MSKLDPNNCFSAQNITRFVSVLDGPQAVSRQLGRLDRSPEVGFIRKKGHQLVDGDGHTPFKIVGPNIYWLGLDENVSPSPSYPSQTRVLEALATAAIMGSTVVRATTLGISVGTPLSVWPTRNNTNNDALDVISFAIYAAKRYGLRLIIPITDQYEYYHGGFKTFLKWRSIPDSDYRTFYDIKSDVYKDFLLYLETIFNHVNPYTQVRIKDEPTIMFWETGNELDDPATAWTEAISQWIHTKAPNHLVSSGRYGISTKDLKISTIDAVTNHFYPPRADKYNSDAALAASHGKVYYAGEYDWSGRAKSWGLLGWVLVPIFLGLLALLIGGCGKCFPIVFEWTTHKAQKPGQTKPQRHRSLTIRQSHVAILMIFIVSPITAGIIYACSIKGTGIEAFLAETELPNSNGSGDLFWSLFGHDDRCCDWVDHTDGFTMHFPGRNDDERGSVARIMQHTYTMRRQVFGPKDNLNPKIEGDHQDWFGIGDRVLVKCPQSLDK